MICFDFVDVILISVNCDPFRSNRLFDRFFQIGANVSDPSQIPAGVGVAILTIFYGLILYCIIDTFGEQKHETA